MAGPNGTGQWIEISADDGGRFRGYLSVPAAGKGPGIVLCQEIFGINAYIREVADACAAEGYVVLAPDLFWRLEQDVELGYSEPEWQKAFALLQKFDADKGTADITAAVRALRTRPEVQGKIGALGFCLGGRLAFLAAARCGVDCAVGYYGVNIDQHLDEAAGIKVPMVLHFAEQDKYAPREKVNRIRDAFKERDEVQIYLYPGVDHAFARPASPHFNQPSAELAHQRSMALFRQVLGPNRGGA